MTGLAALLVGGCEQNVNPVDGPSLGEHRMRATSTTQALSPAADSWVLSTNPAANYGTDTELRTKQVDTNVGRRAFLKFNLSGLSGSVKSAKLRLYNTYLDTGATLAAAGVTDDAWTESALTWSNQPQLGSTLDTGIPAASQWLEFDVTSFVAQQASGDKVVSLAVLEQTLGHDNNFASREYAMAGFRPVLEVTTGFDHHPIADSWVLAADPDTNYGNDTELRTKQVDATTGRRAFLKFDLNDVSGNVVSARLRLYNTYAQAGATLALKGIADDTWSETGLTWNSQPVLGSTLTTATPVANAWMELDVTGFVNQEAGGDKVVSFALVEQTLGHDTNFASRENGTPGNWPVLEVTTSTDYAPIEDSWVLSGSATTNYGTDTQLTTKQVSATAGRRSFLKFDLSGVSGTVQSATLRLYNVYYSGPATVAARAVTDDGWTEMGLTWNNQPALGATLGSGSPAASQWLELDVTGFVNQELAGDKRVSLGVVETTLQHDNNFASREGAAGQQPMLRLQMASATTTVSITPTSASKAEGNSGSTPLTFTVTRSGDTSGTSSVNWAVSGAVTGTDFVGGTLPSGTLAFAADELSKVITVNVQGDTTSEGPEAFTVTLSNPVGCGIGVNSAEGTIQDDDGIQPGVSIAATNAAQLEGHSGSTAFTFTVSRTGTLTATSSVDWAVSGAAVDDADFASGTLPSGTLSFAAGETSKVITVNVQGDVTQESDESFTITMSNPLGCTLVTTTATGTIQNDDGSFPTVSIAAASADKNEGNSGTTPFTFTVSRGTNVSGSSSVRWAVSGAAVNASDFVGGVLPSGTLSFLASETSKVITVNVQGDAVVENDEAFNVTLSSCVSCTVGTATAPGTIRDDDSSDPYPNHPSLNYVTSGSVTADPTTLQKKLDAAQPGDKIVLANGTYAGTYTISKSATRANPIVIQAQNQHQAVFTGQFVLNGSWNYLVGVKFSGNSANAILKGNQNMVARCLFQIGSGTAARILTGNNHRFTRNDITSDVWGLRVGREDQLTSPNKPLIDRNYFHDWPYSPTQINATEALQVGLNRNTHNDRIEAIVEYNLFREIYRDNETVSIKSSYNTFRFNTVDRSTGGNGCKFVQNRHGYSNQYLGNTFDGVHGLKLGDKNNKALGNVFMNSPSGGGLLANAGDCDPDAYAGGCDPRSENALLAGNKADRTEIGNVVGSWSKPAASTRIEAHRDNNNTLVTGFGTAVVRGLETGTVTPFPTTTAENVPAAVRVTPTQVGPSYP